jgi:hypothetical protein
MSLKARFCKVEIYSIKVGLMETDCEHVNWVIVAQDLTHCWSLVLVTLNS